LLKVIFNQIIIDSNGLLEPVLLKSFFGKFFDIFRFHVTARPGPSGLLHKPCFSHEIILLLLPKTCPRMEGLSETRWRLALN
jgi:hypothetical protein